MKLVCLASVVTPQANEHHMSSRIRNFTINLQICWTSRLKIYKDFYSCQQDLWPVENPSIVSAKFQLHNLLIHAMFMF